MLTGLAAATTLATVGIETLTAPPAAAAPTWYHPFTVRGSIPYGGWFNSTVLNTGTPRANVHTGLDYSPPVAGTAIYSIAGGVVSEVGWSSSWGNYVYIDHSDGYRSAYAHMQTGSIAVNVGTAVPASAMIGRIGSTGDTTGAHLHLVIRHHGSLVDPQPLVHNAPLAQPTSPRLILLGTDGDLYAWDNSGWYAPIDVDVLGFSAARDRILAIRPDGTLWEKHGALNASWSFTGASNVRSAYVSNAWKAMIDHDDDLYITSHTGQWQHFLSGVDSFAMTDSRWVATLTNGEVRSKPEGNLSSPNWDLQEYGTKAAVSDDLLVVVKADGSARIKYGVLNNTWNPLTSDAVDVAVAGGRIVVLDSLGDVYARSATGNWILIEHSATKISASDSYLGVIVNGMSKWKSGLQDTWTEVLPATDLRVVG